MNNKGFIATSLIYSFFLIFITLFLTIIADYLQNKVLLNTIEDGIKDNINNTKSIEDFDVGDVITFNISIDEDEDGNKEITAGSRWIIANIIFDYDKTDANDSSEIVLYSLVPENYTIEDFPNECLSEDKLKEDLKSSNNLNGTRLNELIYNTTEDYDLKFISSTDPIDITIKKITGSCAKVTDNDINHSECSSANLAKKCRIRYEYKVGNDKFSVMPDEIGGFTINEVIS